MLRFGKMIAFGMVVLCGFSGMASAATFVVEKGDVFVRQGAGFLPAANGMDVPAGTQILVHAGGKARIAYSSGCQVLLGAGRVWSVANTPPCTNGNALVDLTNPMRNGSLKDGPPIEEARDDRTLIVGGLAVAGGIAAAIILWRKDDSPNRSVSP
jgi:hypothetical protein